MNKIYYLSTCSTCARIMDETGIRGKGFTLQDIKMEQITPAQLDEMKKLAGSYESLFSRRAIKYKEMGLKDQSLKEQDYRKLLLEEYTFLKRPVTLIGDRIFIGNDKSSVSALTAAVQAL